MAFSADEGKEFFREWLKYFVLGDDGIRSILDVGAGAGRYADIVKQIEPWCQRWDAPFPIIDAIEIYEPYIEEFGLWEKYRKVIIGDATELTIEDYDLIILGDVFEHLHKFQAMAFWAKIIKKAKFVFLSIPVKQFKPWFHGYPQPDDDWKINKYEKHQYDWGYKELLDVLGPFTWQIPYKTVVVLIAEGEKKTNGF